MGKFEDMVMFILMRWRKDPPIKQAVKKLNYRVRSLKT